MIQKRTLIGNGTVVTGGARPQIVPQGAVLISGGRVEAVGEMEALEGRARDAWLLDARGGLILPGFVNLHHHFYSALARGLDPGFRPSGFADVLRQLWWRLDRALDRDSVRLSALLTLADCIRWGCTTVFDHHASPSCIPGILDVLAGAVEEAGLSAVLCYEVTDRNGAAAARAGLEENLRFLSGRDAGRVRGALGLHASFTLRDETLAEAGRRRPAGAACHVHVAEDPVDVAFSVETFGAGPIARLDRAGLLDERTIVAHGIHLPEAELDLAIRRGAVLVHNPESNMNNGVGRFDPLAAAERGATIGLGTDGMSSSMLRALRAAFLALRDGRRDPGAGFTVLPGLLLSNALLARRLLDEPHLGELVPGAPADVAVVDAPPPTPLTVANLFGHLVYGAAEAPVRHTVARGVVLMENFQLTTLDPAALAAEARRTAPDVWRRFAALDARTPFVAP